MNTLGNKNMQGKTPAFLKDNGSKKQGRGLQGLFLMAFLALFLNGNVWAQTTEINSVSGLNSMTTNGSYIITGDFDASGYTTKDSFTGTLTAKAKSDGTFPVITGLTQPLFTTVTDARISNIMLKEVSISQDGDVGAICCTANGDSRIYSCGILPTNPINIFDNPSTVASSNSHNCGSIVGLLDGTARVINCFSYAWITQGGGGNYYVGGLVGNNSQTSSQSSINTIVVNCMFYGDITASTKSPVYGGKTIANTSNSGINNYNYFRQTATFDDDYSNISQYKNSWPAEERFLTRFEYYRSVLNSNRRLCVWWVTQKQFANQTDEDLDLIAKWVLDPTIAPYPILKEWRKYPSVINQDPTQVLNKNNQLISRDNANPYQGKKLGTLTVTVKAGSNNSSANDKILVLPVLDMDTLHHDYCYAKVQLPYYNEQFGDPTSTDHSTRYGKNYSNNKVVTGWKIISVTGGNPGSFKGYASPNGSYTPDEISATAWEDGFNFADRNCTNKDLYGKSGRVFAQGGYYYVPEGVTDITIEAYWGNAVYLQNGGRYLDRLDLADKNFSPAGTMPSTFNGQTVYDNIQTAISHLDTENTGVNVYDQAVVLVSNYQFKNLANQGNLGWNNTNGSTSFANNLRPFTWTCVDLDFDNEPDYCLELQYGQRTTRVNIHPVRFDFIPIVDLGLAIKKSSNPYGCGIFIPRGHFEITETAFMHTNQFEYDGHRSLPKETAPLILNGGQYEQFVTTVETFGSISNHTNYIIIGGHVWMKKFTPGSHVDEDSKPTRLCAVSVLGAEFQEFYLTGMFRADISDNVGNPHCYTNGGRFGLMAGAGMEQVNGDVTFKIDHSIVDEFYGGGINSDKPVMGNIHVDIDNSLVGYYCGGPKTGNMQDETEVITTAKGSTFGKFFGGGNGGNNLTRNRLWDNTINGGTQVNLTPNDWNNTGHFSEFNPFTFVNEGVGYHAQFEFELMNNSGGDNDNVVARTYRWDAQFSMTTVQKVTSTLTDCHVKQEFYGGGNLSPVNGNVVSTLDNTIVDGSAFGAGFSATIPSFSVHKTSPVIYPSRDIAGICHPGSLEYQKDGDVVRLYTWIDDAGLQRLGVTGISTSNPDFSFGGKWYCYTSVELSNLGTVYGDATLIIKGNSVIQGNVYGGGDESKVIQNTTVLVKDRTKVLGNIYGGGNIGKVGGDTKVIINGTTPQP